MQIKKCSNLTLSFALSLIALVGVTGAKAGTLYWDGNGTGASGNPPTAGVGGNGTWDTSTTANWWTGTAYQMWNGTGGQDIADFRVASATVNVSGTVNVNTVNIVNPAVITFTNGTLAFPAGGGIIEVNTSVSHVFIGPLTGKVVYNSTGNTTTTSQSGGIGTITNNNTGLTSFELNAGGAGNQLLVSHLGALGPNSGPLKITKGVVGLSAAANTTYNSWLTDFAGGVLRLRVAGTSTYSGNGSLSANTDFATIAAATLVYSGTLDLGVNTLTLAPQTAASGAITLNGAVSGSGNLTINNSANGNADGLGTVTLGAANPSFTGTATTTAGKGPLALNNVNALQAATLNTGLPGSQSVSFIVAGNNTYNLGALQGTNGLAIGANTISVGSKAGSTFFGGPISGSGGSLVKVGTSTLTLTGTNTFTGLTSINAGTIALGITGSLAGNIAITNGATLDTTATNSFTWGASASLIAGGRGTNVGTLAAELKAGTAISLGSRPVTLYFTPAVTNGETTRPALYVSSGALTLNSAITVVNNGTAPLGEGTNVLIAQASGSISGTPTLSGTVGGQGIAAGKTAFIQVSGGQVQLVVQGALPSSTTLARGSGTGSSTTYGDTLQFDVSVTPSAATGSIELRAGGASGILIGTGTLSGGACTITPAANALSAVTHNNIVALYLGSVTYQASTSSALSPAQVVAAKALTVSGMTASNKLFDGTTAATVSGGSLVGVVSGDTVTLNQTGIFNSAGPGTAIGVTSTSTLGGAVVTNYSLTQPTGLSADIIATAIWTNALGGIWGTNVNWTNGVVGVGSGVTADFSRLDATADVVVTNDSRTIGRLIFGDVDTNSAAGWFVTNNTLTLAGGTPTITVNALGAGKAVTINSVVAGASGLTKTGAGTLALNGANTYTGGTFISNGIVTFNADSGFGAVPGSATPGNIVLDGGGVALTGANQAINPNRGIFIGAGGGSIASALNNNFNLTANAIIAGPGQLTLGNTNSAGIILGAQNTFSGGSILIGPPSAIIFSMANSVGAPGSLTSGTLGTGPVTFNGAGMRSTTSAATTNGNAINFAADTLFPSVGGEKTLNLAGPVMLTNSSRILTVNIGATVTTESLVISGAIGDNGSNYALTKAGTGNLVLSGANTFSGGVTNSGGILTLNHTNALGSGTLTINAGATRVVVTDGLIITNNLTYNGGGAGSRGVIENSGSGNATLSGGTITINSNATTGGHFASTGGGTLTVADPINSSANVFSRIGTVIFSGGGSYANFTVNNGTARLGANNGLSTSATVDVGNFQSTSPTLDLAGYNQSLVGITRTESISVTSTITNSATASDATLTLTGTSSYPGVIRDSGNAGARVALIIGVSAALTLSGTNTYSGATTVNGTLLVTGNSSASPSAITVNSGATLGGSGTIGGNVTLASGAFVTNRQGSPLTINGTLAANNNTVNVSTPSALGAGDYLLITNTAGGISGTFNTAPNISGSGLAANTTAAIVTSVSNVILRVISFTPTTTTVASSANPSTYGQSVTFTATIAPASGAVVPPGSVQFKTNGVALGSPVTVTTGVSPNGTAATSTAFLPFAASPHTVTAEFTATGTFLNSTGTLSGGQTVNRAALTITANNTNKIYDGIAFTGGAGVTYAGFVNSETNSVLTGTLAYGGTSQGATNAGSYTIIPSGFSAANYTLTYANGALTISQATTSIGAASSKNPSGYLDAVSFLATLPAAASGNVVFLSTNGAFSTNALAAGNATSLSLTNLPRGTNAITFAYAGDVNYSGSTNSLNQIVTNHPPVANAASYTRNAAFNTFKIAVTNLLTNASDVDGDSLTLVTVGSSTNGGTTMISGGFVLYHNPNAVADEFSYSVSDGFGGTNSATVSLTIDSTPLFGQSSIADTSGGTATLIFAGIPGFSYSIERSTNLPNWSVIFTTNAPAGGTFQYIDDPAPQPSAFYRLKYNP